MVSKVPPAMLVGPVEKRLIVLLREIAGEMEITIHALEVMPDHVHLFLESDPTRSVPAGESIQGPHVA